MKVSELLDLLPSGARVMIRDAEDNDLEDVDCVMRRYSNYRDYDIEEIVPVVTQLTFLSPHRAALIVRI